MCMQLKHVDRTNIPFTLNETLQLFVLASAKYQTGRPQSFILFE